MTRVSNVANIFNLTAAGVQLAGGVNFTGTADDILTLQYRSSVWYEVGRSAN